MLKKHGSCFELFRVTHITGYRKVAKGEVREVKVEILDAGPAEPDIRYQVKAISDGREANGDPEASLTEAIMGLHWEDLHE